MALSLSQLQIPHQEVSCNPPREETDVSESNEQPTTPAVFTKFPDLPPELRLKIWNLMLPGSRVVHLRFEEPGRIFLSPSLPVTLQINRESRLESLAQLTRNGDSPLSESSPLNYFFSTLDIVSIDKHSLGKIAFSFFIWHLKNRLGPEGLSQISQLAIEDVVWSNINHRNAKPTEWGDWIFQLDKIIIFHKESQDEDAMNDLELVEPPIRDVALEAQVKETFTKLFPPSSSSTCENEIPEIRVLLGRKPEPLPAPPSQALPPVPEVEELENAMEDLILL